MIVVSVGPMPNFDIVLRMPLRGLGSTCGVELEVLFVLIIDGCVVVVLVVVVVVVVESIEDLDVVAIICE